MRNLTKFCLFSFLIIALSACSGGANKLHYKLSGTIEDNPLLNDNIFALALFQKGVPTYSDSVVIKDNQFMINDTIRESCVMTASFPGSTYGSFSIIIEPDTVGIAQIKMNGDEIRVGGTPLNEKLQQFNDKQKEFNIHVNEMDSAFRAKRELPGFKAADEKAYYDNLIVEINKYRDETIAIIRENVDNVFGEYLFMSQYMFMDYERRDQMMTFATERIKQGMH